MALKSSNKIDTNTYEIEVTVDANVFAEACKQAYLKDRKHYQLPGFRKGKAPMQMIEKMYGEGAFYETALDAVYPEAVSKAIEEAGINAVDAPYDVDVVTISKSEGVEMKMKVTSYPEVKLGKYTGLEVSPMDVSVSDEDVEAEIKKLQERNSRIVTITDRAAEMGDTVELDFEGFVDGVAFDGGKGEKYPLELGSNSFIPGFEEQVAGHNSEEEFDVNVTFPEEYAEELAGKDAVFKCTIHDIKAKEYDDVDDEFVKNVSEFDTVEELKADLKSHLEEDKKAQSDRDLENQLVDLLVEGMTVEIPEVMIDSETDNMINEYSYQLQSQGIDMKTYLTYIGQSMDEFKAQFRDNAKKRVESMIAIKAVVEAEKIEATQEEIDAKYKEFADQYQMKEEQVRGLVSESNVSVDITNDKAIKFLVEKSKKVAKKAPAKKTAAKKTTTKKSETTAKKAPAKKTAAKKTTTTKKTTKKED